VSSPLPSSSRVTVFWEAPVQLAQGALDYVFGASLFSAELPDSSVDRYELELYNTSLRKYINQGYVYSARADLDVGDVENVKVRIRAILRDETKTSWVESGTLVLSSFAAIFADSDNAVFLSFV
jgi:hypothetical protein